MKHRITIGILSSLAVVQLLLLVYLHLHPHQPRAPERGLVTGDTLSWIDGLNANGSPVHLSLSTASRPLVVLAFDSECTHCETVAPAWKEWLDRDHGADLVAVSRNAPGVAVRYGERHGWRVRVVADAASQNSAASARLLDRTPWIYLLDIGGEILFEGHGSRTAEVDSILARRPASPTQ